VFTELGYTLSSKAAEKPWAYERGGEDAEGVQTRSMSTALQAIAGEPDVLGAFVWKWFPGRRGGEDFAAASPAMRKVLRSAWGNDPNGHRSK